jgi:hypothetical protein
MNFGYALIGILGLAFLYMGLTSEPAQYRTIVQAVIFLALGLGGFWMNRKPATESQRHRESV